MGTRMKSYQRIVVWLLVFWMIQQPSIAQSDVSNVLIQMDATSLQNLEGKAREALVRHVTEVILNPSHPRGRKVRAAVLDHRSLVDQRRMQEEIVTEANQISLPSVHPGQSWELKRSSKTGHPNLYLAGYLFGLYTEIEFNPEGTEVIQVNMEVD